MNGYYDIPMLKRPKWGWEIALYFFAEGISAGAYILGMVADNVAPRSSRRFVRAARWLSLGMLAPCPPLLIADLGRPERFHHMLRIVKRSSPMNIGAWALTGYGVHSAALALLPAPRLVEWSGLPFAFTMLAYQGVLLSTTSTPVWSETRYLGALFSASSFSTAASALTLIEAAGGRDVPEPLHRIELAAKAAEGVALVAYVGGSGRAARPLTSGSQSGLFWAGAVVVGLVLPLVVSAGKPSRTRTIASSVLSLAGGLMLKWAIVHAGQESADDPEAARRASAAASW